MCKFIEKPIFVGGMFKSGTSLLRAMIGNHSQVVSGLETYWFELDWKNIHSENMQKRLGMISSFYDLREQEFQKIVTESECPEEFLNRMFSFQVKIQNKKIWVEKTPGNIIHILRIKEYWPQGRFFHIIRDPRDIFSSLLEADKWSDLDQFLERWIPVFQAVKKYKSLFSNDSPFYNEIRYEELVLNPERVMKFVCEMSALNFEKETIEFHGVPEDFEKVKKITGKSSSTLKRLAEPLQTTRIGLWKETLSKNTIVLLEERVKRADLFDEYKEACYS